MEQRLLNFLGGLRKCAAGRAELRVLTAAELLQARREAAELAQEDGQALGLCRNACILARAAQRRGQMLFPSGRAVLEGMSAERILGLMERYEALSCREDPSCCNFEQFEAVRDALRSSPYERLKWKILRAFGALPSEARAKQMTAGDYLLCAAQLWLDSEEQLDRLCPSCRREAERARCPVCGVELEQTGENPGFDEARFEELSGHGLS